MKSIGLVVLLSILFGLLFTTAYAGERDGMSGGVIYKSVSVKNGWDGPTGADFFPTESEGSGGQWSIPIYYTNAGKDVEFDMVTDLAGWIILMAAGMESPDLNDKYKYTDINIGSLRMGVDIFELGVPILLGGQAGAGYMGIDGAKTEMENYFEQGSYFSYGANISTNIEFGEAFLRTHFMYDWLSMGDEKKGNSWSVDVEYFPFSSNHWTGRSRIQLFLKSVEMKNPRKSDEAPDYPYSTFQLGIGLIFNIDIF